MIIREEIGSSTSFKKSTNLPEPHHLPLQILLPCLQPSSRQITIAICNPHFALLSNDTRLQSLMLIHNLHLALIIYAILSTSHFSQLQSSKLLRSTHDVPRNKTRFRYIILISLDKLFYNFNQYLRTNPVVMLILICSYYSSYSIVQDVRFIFSAAKSISLRYDKAVSTVWKGSQWL